METQLALEENLSKIKAASDDIKIGTRGLHNAHVIIVILIHIQSANIAWKISENWKW